MNKPIIYCNDSFCTLIKYKRPEVMQKPCTCEFLYGTTTSTASKIQVTQALQRTEETQIAIILYKSDYATFLCNMLIAPVNNENSEVILFILNFEDVNVPLDSKFSGGKFHFFTIF